MRSVLTGGQNVDRSVFPSPTSPPTLAMGTQKQLQAFSDEFQQLQTG